MDVRASMTLSSLPLLFSMQTRTPDTDAVAGNATRLGTVLLLLFNSSTVADARSYVPRAVS